MPAENIFTFVPDKRGMWWDLALYVPTIVALLSVASQFWYSGNQGFTYLLIFLTTFIALIGFNRVFKTRLMVLPKSPVALCVSKKNVKVSLKNNDELDLAQEIRFFSDMAGKSFGLTGLDLSGKRQQFVFHKGQFANPADFDAVKASLRVFK